MRLKRTRKRGDRAEARDLLKQLRTLPRDDPMDPGYRRLQYARYADLSGRPDKSAYAESRIMPPAWCLRWPWLREVLTGGIIGGLVRGS